MNKLLAGNPINSPPNPNIVFKPNLTVLKQLWISNTNEQTFKQKLHVLKNKLPIQYETSILEFCFNCSKNGNGCNSPCGTSGGDNGCKGACNASSSSGADRANCLKACSGTCTPTGDQINNVYGNVNFIINQHGNVSVTPLSKQTNQSSQSNINPAICLSSPTNSVSSLLTSHTFHTATHLFKYLDCSNNKQKKIAEYQHFINNSNQLNQYQISVLYYNLAALGESIGMDWKVWRIIKKYLGEENEQGQEGENNKQTNKKEKAIKLHQKNQQKQQKINQQASGKQKATPSIVNLFSFLKAKITLKKQLFNINEKAANKNSLNCNQNQHNINAKSKTNKNKNRNNLQYLSEVEQRIVQRFRRFTNVHVFRNYVANLTEQNKSFQTCTLHQLYNLALSLKHTNNLISSIKLFQKLLTQLSPNSSSSSPSSTHIPSAYPQSNLKTLAKINIAQCYLKLGETNQAISIVRKLIQSGNYYIQDYIRELESKVWIWSRSGQILTIARTYGRQAEEICQGALMERNLNKSSDKYSKYKSMQKIRIKLSSQQPYYQQSDNIPINLTEFQNYNLIDNYTTSNINIYSNKIIINNNDEDKYKEQQSKYKKDNTSGQKQLKISKSLLTNRKMLFLEEKFEELEKLLCNNKLNSNGGNITTNYYNTNYNSISDMNKHNNANSLANIQNIYKNKTKTSIQKIRNKTYRQMHKSTTNIHEPTHTHRNNNINSMNVDQYSNNNMLLNNSIRLNQNQKNINSLMNKQLLSTMYTQKCKTFNHGKQEESKICNPSYLKTNNNSNNSQNRVNKISNKLSNTNRNHMQQLIQSSQSTNFQSPLNFNNKISQFQSLNSFAILSNINSAAVSLGSSSQDLVGFISRKENEEMNDDQEADRWGDQNLIDHYWTVIKNSKDQMQIAEKYLNLGDVYVKEKDYQSALMVYKKCLQKGRLQAYGRIGNLYYNKGKHIASIDYYQKYLKQVNNSDHSLKLKLLHCYTKLPTKYKKATEQLKQLIEANPHDKEAHILYVTVLMKQKHYTKAIQQCQKYKKIHYMCYQNLHLMGLLYRCIGDYKKAFGCFVQALRVEPGGVSSLIQLTYLAEVKDFLPELIEIYKKALFASKKNHQILQILYFLVSKKQLHLQQIKSSLNFSQLVSIGDFFMQKQMIQQAQLSYTEAGGYTNNTLLKQKLGNLQYHKKNYPQAEKYYKQSQKRRTVFKIQVKLGDTLLKQNKFTQAEQIFKQCLTKQKENKSICLNMLGQCYYGMGKYSIALEKFQEASKCMKCLDGGKQVNINMLWENACRKMIIQEMRKNKVKRQS